MARGEQRARSPRVAPGCGLAALAKERLGGGRVALLGARGRTAPEEREPHQRSGGSLHASSRHLLQCRRSLSVSPVTARVGASAGVWMSSERPGGTAVPAVLVWSRAVPVAACGRGASGRLAGATGAGTDGPVAAAPMSALEGVASTPVPAFEGLAPAALSEASSSGLGVAGSRGRARTWWTTRHEIARSTTAAEPRRCFAPGGGRPGGGRPE